MRELHLGQGVDHRLVAGDAAWHRLLHVANHPGIERRGHRHRIVGGHLLHFGRGGFLGQQVPAFGHQRVEAVHQLLDLFLVVLDGRVIRIRSSAAARDSRLPAHVVPFRPCGDRSCARRLRFRSAGKRPEIAVPTPALEHALQGDLQSLLHAARIGAHALAGELELDFDIAFDLLRDQLVLLQSRVEQRWLILILERRVNAGHRRGSLLVLAVLDLDIQAGLGILLPQLRPLFFNRQSRGILRVATQDFVGQPLGTVEIAGGNGLAAQLVEAIDRAGQHPTGLLQAGGADQGKRGAVVLRSLLDQHRQIGVVVARRQRQPRPNAAGSVARWPGPSNRSRCCRRSCRCRSESCRDHCGAAASAGDKPWSGPWAADRGGPQDLLARCGPKTPPPPWRSPARRPRPACRRSDWRSRPATARPAADRRNNW